MNRPNVITGPQDRTIVAQNHIRPSATVDEVALIITVRDVVAAVDVIVAVTTIDGIAALLTEDYIPAVARGQWNPKNI